MPDSRTWHRIKLNTLQRRLDGQRAWTWETREERGRKRLGLRGARGRFYWFKLNHGGAFIQRTENDWRQT